MSEIKEYTGPAYQRLFNQINETGTNPTGSQMEDIIQLVKEEYTNKEIKDYALRVSAFLTALSDYDKLKKKGLNRKQIEVAGEYCKGLEAELAAITAGILKDGTEQQTMFKEV